MQSGSSRSYVINEENVPSLQCIGIDDLEDILGIPPPLSAVLLCLCVGVNAAFSALRIYVGTDNLADAVGDVVALIVTTLVIFLLGERNGDDEVDPVEKTARFQLCSC